MFFATTICALGHQGDYEGLASFCGVSHPIWMDSRQQPAPITGCGRGFAMEEVFTAVVK